MKQSEKERRRKRPGKSTNAKKAFGEEQEKDMMIPLCIDDYNQHMGGVDTADQLRCYYDLQLISWRTWWPMLFWAYDTMAVNAFTIFKSMPQTPGPKHKQFRLQCAWGLINALGGAKSK